MPLHCPYCEFDPLLSVKHFFECPKLTDLRNYLQIPYFHIEDRSDSSPSLSHVFTNLHQSTNPSFPHESYSYRQAHSPGDRRLAARKN